MRRIILLACCLSLPVACVHRIGSTLPTTRLLINGKQRDTTRLSERDTSFVYAFEAKDAAECHMTSPVGSGITFDAGGVISKDRSPFFPAQGHSVTFRVSCSNAYGITTTEAVITR